MWLRSRNRLDSHSWRAEGYEDYVVSRPGKSEREIIRPAFPLITFEDHYIRPSSSSADHKMFLKLIISYRIFVQIPLSELESKKYGVVVNWIT
jgi:hypothetical protein